VLHILSVCLWLLIIRHAVCKRSIILSPVRILCVCVFVAFNYPACSTQAQYYIVTCTYSECVSVAFNYPACSMQAQYHIVTCAYSVCVCLWLLIIRHAVRKRIIILSPVARATPAYISIYLINGNVFGKENLLK